MKHERSIKPASIHSVFLRLTETRMAWKLSRHETAGRMGCDAVTLQKLELGMISPSLRMLIAWADALGFDISLWPKQTPNL